MTGDRGGVTVEAALATAALAVVLALCVAGVAAVSTHVRCVDAAREAARLAARGDDGTTVARSLAPDGAGVQIRYDGDFVVATVTARSLLPGLTVAGRAVAAREPGTR
ncbi:TadE family type IV pilus minor pilin [Mycolicibacterium phlei]|uniref:TadE family type IV pilus minor pilin n=1 Tax=Mycolicibacterium phlei TaxID=1771 RepID=UPI002351D68F|nr:TadE family type IV pilus minor pilin [Mycolicibacterium phlei]